MVQTYLNSVKIAFHLDRASACWSAIPWPTASPVLQADRWRNILLMLVILPFWTSFLLRVYAWIGPA